MMLLISLLLFVTSHTATVLGVAEKPQVVDTDGRAITAMRVSISPAGILNFPGFTAARPTPSNQTDAMCGFRLYVTDGDVPFWIATPVDNLARLFYDGPPLVKDDQKFMFDVAAYDCTAVPTYSNRVSVVVVVTKDKMATEYKYLEKADIVTTSTDQSCVPSWSATHSALYFSPLTSAAFPFGDAILEACESSTNEDINVDAPLSETNTVLHSAIGGCWRSTDGLVGQHLLGELAGVALYRNHLIAPASIACLSNCGERLVFEKLKDLDVGMTLSYSVDHTRLTLSGTQANAVAIAVRDVGYDNPRVHTTPGERRLAVRTEVLSGEKKVVLNALVIKVVVKERPSHTLTLTSEQTTMKALGVAQRLFPGLQITEKHDLQSDVRSTAAFSRLFSFIESCVVTYDPALTPDEHIAYPRRMAHADFNIDSVEERNGLSLAGLASAAQYEQVLRKVEFFALGAAHSRTFTLSCRGNGVTAEPLIVSCEATPEATGGEQPGTGTQFESVEPRHEAKKGRHLNPTSYIEPRMAAHAQTRPRTATTSAWDDLPSGVAVILAVCAALFVGMIAFAAHRLRTSANRNDYKRARKVQVSLQPDEMEWDDDEVLMNLHVNPLENPRQYDSEDSEEDDAVDRRGLQWDDSDI